jgi:hypothetical protein
LRKIKGCSAFLVGERSEFILPPPLFPFLQSSSPYHPLSFLLDFAADASASWPFPSAPGFGSGGCRRKGRVR